MNEKQLSFDMKIARRLDTQNKLNKHGCHTFSKASIDNIPYLDIFAESEINRKITEGCKAVLRASMSTKNPYRFGEMGLLISLLEDYKGNKIDCIKQWFKGEYHRINIKSDNRYMNAVKNRISKDLAFIHNHPNNSNFSVNDLVAFSMSPSIICMIAVGNTHNIHIILRTDEYKSKNIKKFIQDYSNELNEHTKIEYIINNNSELGIEYHKFNRRNRK